MAHVVFKYQVPPRTSGKIEVPAGSRFLSIEKQGDDVVAYFLVNREAARLVEAKHAATRSVHTAVGMTGIDVEGLEYAPHFIRTLLFMEDCFVTHFFCSLRPGECVS